VGRAPGRAHARTNALGWRDKPRDIARTPGRQRAILLGDSYVFGVGVDDGLRVSEALEREVPELEAWNLGVTAYGPDQELILLESVGRAYDPDVVVWFASLANDVEDVRYSRRYSFAKPWYELDGERLVPHAPAPSLLARLRDASYLTELLMAPFHGRALAHDVAPPWVGRDGLPLFVAIARALQKTAEMHEKRLLCVVIPSAQADADADAPWPAWSPRASSRSCSPGPSTTRARAVRRSCCRTATGTPPVTRWSRASWPRSCVGAISCAETKRAGGRCPPARLTARRERLSEVSHSCQMTSSPFVRLNVSEVQKAAALRYQTW